MKIICNITHKGGPIWEIEHFAGSADKPTTRSWLDIREIASATVGPAPDGDFWCHISLKNGTGHSFYAEHEAALAGLVDAWRVHVQFGRDKT